MIEQFKNFQRESNKIEGELDLIDIVQTQGRLNKDDLKCLTIVRDGIESEDDILRLHGILGKYLNHSWVGKYRTCNVRVGSYVAPKWEKVEFMMHSYMDKFEKMNSWEAHNEFEKIHPFQDLNGRVGRLIWLSKALNEGYYFKLPFLQAYYYQTLNHVNK